jgi:stage II sporulation SpoAA-like protein
MGAAVATADPNGGDRVYFNRPGVALVTWNPDLRAACLEAQGWATTAEAQAVLDAVIRALRAHHGSRWLIDGRKMKVIKQADQDWIKENWLPRAAAAGLRLAALVMPESGLAMMNIDDVARVSENGIDVRYFSTVEEAAAWLTEPPTPDGGK